MSASPSSGPSSARPCTTARSRFAAPPCRGDTVDVADAAFEPLSAPFDPAGFVREHRARLVGMLVRWCGDVQLAEDAFGDAIERALTAWPASPPADPYAWVVVVAKNRVRDILRSAEHRRNRALDETDELRADTRPPTRDDDTLALMFACVHPMLDRGVHAPLILQVVLGVSTVDIATSFALPSATLSKRLVRAKQKLRADRDAFEVPAGIPRERVAAVLDAIYAAYSIEWLRVAPADSAERVTDEAVHASQLMLTALPHDHEVRGLAALLLYLHSRRSARFRDETLVPTEQQDTALWDAELIGRAERLLHAGMSTARTAPPGPFEWEAAIQSAHSARRRSGVTDWETIAQLYNALVHVTPRKGARVARVVAIARVTDPAIGLRALEQLADEDPTMLRFQPYHAARGALLLECGDALSARRSMQRALDLCTHGPSRRWLSKQIAGIPVS
ncbi:DUF6596 domain-containing protein [Microbacterium sp. SSW1-59]|uniref:RNA polymerase sigma factor n=1 Tax=Microbacterium xanthum TaxID=3079794 RepID=UPI002AD319A3|nr:DUF6596 domain-containing protein [Microbacterium sp. SSW1-59]MDZ8200611.1 DUF6596 domain-containing protein [Microbacterium sp. SSW1-59]